MQKLQQLTMQLRTQTNSVLSHHVSLLGWNADLNVGDKELDMYNKIKSCNGCKHQDGYFCEIKDKWVTEVDQYTGLTLTRYVGGVGPDYRRPNLRVMREGECGTEAKLYEPTLVAKLWAKLFPNDTESVNYGEFFGFMSLVFLIAVSLWFTYMKVVQ